MFTYLFVSLWDLATTYVKLNVIIDIIVVFIFIFFKMKFNYFNFE